MVVRFYSIYSCFVLSMLLYFILREKYLYWLHVWQAITINNYLKVDAKVLWTWGIFLSFSPSTILILFVSFYTGKSYWRGRISTVDLLALTSLDRRHDTQQNDIQQKGTQHNWHISDIKHNNTQHNDPLPLCWMSLCWVSRFNYCYAECHYAQCRYAECRGAV